MLFVVWSRLPIFLLYFLLVNSLNVSQRCMHDTTTFLSELSKDLPAKYAVLMYDAFGKLGSNVEAGNVNWPGSLHECLSVAAPHFNGQYCQVFLKQEDIGYFVGICVPDSCMEDDVETLVLDDMIEWREGSLIPLVPSVFLSEPSVSVIWTQCRGPHNPPIQPFTVFCLCVCCVMVLLPLVASLYVALVKWRGRREVSPSPNTPLTSDPGLYGSLVSNGSPATDQPDSASVEEAASNTDGKTGKECSTKSCLLSCLQSLSLQGASSSVCGGVLGSSSGSCSRAGGSSSSSSILSYPSLNGIRILSLLWIISGHSVQLTSWTNLDNAKQWRADVEGNPFYVFAFSGPVYLAVDTFMLLGGLLSAKSLLALIQRSDDKLNPKLVAHFLFKRFKRVQPLHLFVVCLAVGLYSVVPQGAFWIIADDQLHDCQRYWWSNLLLVNNLLTTTNICAPWTWYLSIDFQFYITTPILVSIYRWNQKVLVGVSGILFVFSCLSGAFLTAILHLPVHQPTTLLYKSYFQYYYNKPYTRYGPYLVGILAGIYMASKSGHFVKHQWQAAVGWLCSLSVMAALVGLAYYLREVPPGPSLPHALYQGVHRTLWALAVSWIILACEEGYGGFVGRFLSMRGWVPLSNISFACYLIHPVLIILYNGKQETTIHYTDLNFFYLFLGHTAFTVCLGYVLTALIEKPFLFLKRSHAKSS